MKRALVVFFGACMGLLVGALASYAFNSWYSLHHVRSDDDSNVLVTLLLFVFFPSFALIGGIAASWLHARRSVS